ncbi:hypothetical protein [Nocardia sp. NPDC057440]|uniref:hypothetical protein n=1 Tax=Nocardia sp. NPDC057440 TaxID=3346134 RepID=UPI0036706459
MSLDRRYVSTADMYFGISRAVDPGFDDAGYDARLGYPSLDNQFDDLARRYGGGAVVIADDVLFSGRMTLMLDRELAKRNVRLAAALCGIAIGNGVNRLGDAGIPTESVISFTAVDDEVCERDFTVLAGSGRKVYGEQLSAVYFDDRFGRPSDWASIPQDAAPKFCLQNLLRNRKLLRADAPFPRFVGYAGTRTGSAIDRAVRERTDV